MIKEWDRTAGFSLWWVFRMQQELECFCLLWFAQPWERLLSFHCRGGNQPRALTVKGETQNSASWTLWCLGYLSLWFKKYPRAPARPPSDSICSRGTAPAQIQEWLITDISCSPRLNVSAWPQNQLWKTRCFFNYLWDSEDKQPDLVSSLFWTEKYTLLCCPDKSRTFAACKMLFLNPTDTSWLENIHTLGWDCVLAEINTLKIETKAKIGRCALQE